MLVPGSVAVTAALAGLQATAASTSAPTATSTTTMPALVVSDFNANIPTLSAAIACNVLLCINAILCFCCILHLRRANNREPVDDNDLNYSMREPAVDSSNYASFAAIQRPDSSGRSSTSEADREQTNTDYAAFRPVSGAADGYTKAPQPAQIYDGFSIPSNGQSYATLSVNELLAATAGSSASRRRRRQQGQVARGTSEPFLRARSRKRVQNGTAVYFVNNKITFHPQERIAGSYAKPAEKTAADAGDGLDDAADALTERLRKLEGDWSGQVTTTVLLECDVENLKRASMVYAVAICALTAVVFWIGTFLILHIANDDDLTRKLSSHARVVGALRQQVDDHIGVIDALRAL